MARFPSGAVGLVLAAPPAARAASRFSQSGGLASRVSLAHYAFVGGAGPAGFWKVPPVSAPALSAEATALAARIAAAEDAASARLEAELAAIAPRPAAPFAGVPPVSGSPLPLVHDARRLCSAFRAGNPFVGVRELLALRSRLESAYLRPCSARVARALHVAVDQIDLALDAGPGPSAPAVA